MNTGPSQPEEVTENIEKVNWDKRSNVKWQELSENQWNDFWQHIHRKDIAAKMRKTENPQDPNDPSYGEPPTIRDLISKETPEDIMDWVKLIDRAHQSVGLMSSTDKEGDRLRFFSHNGDIQPPKDHMGEQAFQFYEQSMEKYANGEIAPPFTRDKVQSLYDLFKKIEEDLTSSPKWQEFWDDIRENRRDSLISLSEEDHLKGRLTDLRRQYVNAFPDEHGITDEKVLNYHNISRDQIISEIYGEDGKENATEETLDYLVNGKIAELQQQMFSAYRFKMFNQTTFTDRLEGETDNQYKMREFRCQDFLQQVNKLMRTQGPDEIYKTLHDELGEKLTDEVEQAVNKAREQVQSGMGLNDVAMSIAEEIQRLRKSKEYEYLGEEGVKILDTLSNLRHDCINLQEAVDSAMQEAMESFLPQHGLGQSKRTIELAREAVEKIQQSKAYQSLSVIGPQVITNHFMSHDALTRLYKQATKMKAEYFYQHIPDDFEMLNSNKDGLKWVENLRSRRDIIKEMYTMVKNDETKFSKRSGIARFFGIKNSSKKHEVLSKLQKMYIDAFKQDLQGMPLELAQQRLQEMKTDPMFKPVASSTMKQLFSNRKEEMKTQMKECEKLVAKRASQQQTQSSTQDQETGTPYDKDHRKSQVFECANSMLDQLKDKLQNEFKGLNFDESKLETQPEIQIHYDDLEVMLRDPKQHTALIEQLIKMEDLQERNKMIEHLYMSSFDTQDEDANILNLFRLSDVKEDIIRGQLQDLYMDTLEQQWTQKAATLTNSEHQNGLSVEQVDQLYNEVIAPAYDTPILTFNVSDKAEKAIKQKLDAQVEKLQGLCKDRQDFQHVFDEKQESQRRSGSKM